MTIQRSSGGGGGVAGLSLLFDSTLGAASATIDTGANGIAAGHKHLFIFTLLRCDGAGIFDSLIQFNGDTGAHYNDAAMRNSAGAISAFSDQLATGSEWCQMPGTTASASYPAAVVGFIPGYDQTTFFKAGVSASGFSTDAAGQVRMIFCTFSWASTAAINQITMLPFTAGQKFIAGSRMTVYGTS